MPQKRIQSGKISGNHTTLIEAAIPLVRAVVDMPCVRRVSPGFIVGNVGKLQRYKATVKIVDVAGGLKLTVRAESSVQEIFIYCDQVFDVRNAIHHEAEKNQYQTK